MILLLKHSYRKTLRWLELLPAKLEGFKTYLAEWYAIYRKAPLYRHIKWSKNQQEEFDQYWTQIYGKKISNRWHKLYQSFNGTFCVDYIPEMLYTTKIEPLLNDRVYAKVLEDKSFINTLCAGETVVVPKTICVCSAGRFFDGDFRLITKSEAVECLKRERNIVIKPTVGSSSGKGILFLPCSADIGKAELDLILTEAGNDAIVQKCITPHPDFARFNRTSINTIRIITYIINEKMNHVPLAFRIGREGKQVDNIHAGGIVVGVHDDGTLLDLGYELGYGDTTKTYTNHPDNGVRFAGFKLPCIPQIIDAAYRIHGKMPHTGIVSWDFTVNEKEEVVLIEANIMGQSAWFPQIIHGKGLFGEDTAVVLKAIKGNKGETDGNQA